MSSVAVVHRNHLGEEARRVVARRLKAWEEDDWPRRLWDRDWRLWSQKKVPEIVDRLGWLDLPRSAATQAPPLTAFARELQEEGLRHVVVLGMGGSSLSSEVFRKVWGPIEGHPRLQVLDCTHPQAVHDIDRAVSREPTLFVVSSKSGTTIETLSFLRFFWERTARDLNDPGRRFVAITDADTPLAVEARRRHFRRVFEAPADVGGRYSALTPFGLVPAAAAGIDVAALAASALDMEQACGPEVAAPDNPALHLGAILGEAARAGRDKVTFLTTDSLEAFPLWVEQLLAESTGKSGTGLIPVVGEPAAAPELYGEDRVFLLLSLRGDDTGPLDLQEKALVEAGHPVVRYHLEGRRDLGGEFFRWEMAVAAAGAVLGVHPFDQPDVELAKRLTREVLSRQDGMEPAGLPRADANDPEGLGRALEAFLGESRPGDYLALQAWIPESTEASFALRQIRRRLRDTGGLATTLGYGPRYLHSTGQLHKGGPNTGLYLQLVDQDRADVPIPEMEDDSFRDLMEAQALGDARALLRRERRFLRILLGENPAHGLARLVSALSGQTRDE